MSKVKIVNDLFLGNIELTKLQQFLSEDGFRKLLKLQTYSFGIIRDKVELSNGVLTSDNFKIVAGTGAGTIKLAIDSYAIDSDFNLGLANIGAKYHLRLNLPYWAYEK